MRVLAAILPVACIITWARGAWGVMLMLCGVVSWPRVVVGSFFFYFVWHPFFRQEKRKAVRRSVLARLPQVVPANLQEAPTRACCPTFFCPPSPPLLANTIHHERAPSQFLAVVYLLFFPLSARSPESIGTAITPLESVWLKVASQWVCLLLQVRFGAGEFRRGGGGLGNAAVVSAPRLVRSDAYRSPSAGGGVFFGCCYKVERRQENI